MGAEFLLRLRESVRVVGMRESHAQGLGVGMSASLPSPSLSPTHTHMCTHIHMHTHIQMHIFPISVTLGGVIMIVGVVADGEFHSWHLVL